MNGLHESKAKRRVALLALSVSLSLGMLANGYPVLAGSGSQAIAAASTNQNVHTVPRTDYFGSVTSTEAPPATGSNHGLAETKLPPGSQGAGGLMSERTPQVLCFENLDDIRAKYRVAQPDKVILDRPINQEAERLQQWIEAAHRVITTNLACAKALRSAVVPPGSDDLKSFRELTADWYQDVAGIYSDLIKPRPSAKTYEELQEQLQDITKRQQSLRQTQKDLSVMEVSLRKKYRVHHDINTDSLARYLMQKD